MPRDACCWRRRARTEPESPVYTKETVAEMAVIVEAKPDQENEEGNKELEVQVLEDVDVDESGNPRNKTALQPGHSLMDWIRLGQSGRDLTGVGRRAGTLSVSPRQLAEHCTEEDAWVAIRGKVYNVSGYLPFHPGGRDELMKGAGKDATQLFNEVHAWVNYESILQKCLIGRLTSLEPDVDTEALFYGTNATTPTKPPPPTTKLMQPVASATTNGSTTTTLAASACPRFDWIQKMDYITTIFYTKAYSNPQVQVTAPTKQNQVEVIIFYDQHIYTNKLHFHCNIHWPCKVSITQESGKVEVNFRKIISKVWENYGTLDQTCEKIPIEDQNRLKYVVMNKFAVNHNTCFMALQRSDGVKQTVPIGWHINVYGQINDQSISRCYTPIPCEFMQRLLQDREAYAGDVCLLIKGYKDGLLSSHLCSKSKGDILELSTPLGNFDLKIVENKEAFLMLAAGTGITPMIGMLRFLLERRIIRCQKLSLLFFNRTEQDILCKEQLENLKEDTRFTFETILSEPKDSWKGHRGHVTTTLVKSALDHLCSNSHLFPVDVFPLVCGPTVFTNLSRSLLEDMGYKKDQMHIFVG